MNIYKTGDDAWRVRLSIYRNFKTSRPISTAEFALQDMETVEDIADFLLTLLTRGIEVEE